MKKKLKHLSFLRRKSDFERYFSGYEKTTHLDANGKRKQAMVYTGDYYSFNLKGSALRTARIQSAVLSIAAVVLFIGLSMIPFSGCGWIGVSLPSLVALLPALYLLVGAWNLCTAKEPFEQRIPDYSYGRMKRSIVGLLCLLGLTGAMAAGYWIWTRPEGNWPLNCCYLAGIAVCLVLLLLARRVLQRFAAVKVEHHSGRKKA